MSKQSPFSRSIFANSPRKVYLRPENSPRKVYQISENSPRKVYIAIAINS